MGNGYLIIRIMGKISAELGEKKIKLNKLFSKPQIFFFFFFFLKIAAFTFLFKSQLTIKKILVL